jgi:hypothetical protein
MLQLSMNCWNSAFNARGSRLIIVVVQLGAEKIYVAAVLEVLRRRSGKRRKKETRDGTQFTTKIDGFLSFIPAWMLMYFFAVFFESHPLYDQTQGSGAVFFLLYG